MRITMAELYDQYYSASRNLYRGDTNMPNHCHNRVTFYPAGDDTVKAIEDIKAIKQMFEDENTFTQIIPEPDWENTPLMTSELKRFGNDRGKVGELPQYVEDYGKRLVFKSTGHADDRWYDWRLANWDTKWDAYDVEVTDSDPENLEIEFNTAWSPPEAICHALREKYPDTVAISWFYDEPGCEIAGYL
tara:strand:- start:294 stop:860 length:567 start_codon:yes stop_codon:yes gene_type:complete